MFKSSACALVCLPPTYWFRSGVTSPSVPHNRKTTPSHTHTHTHSHLPCSQMGLCPPIARQIKFGPQINIQAKHWFYIIESCCHECTTGPTLDSETTHTHTHAHKTIAHWSASCAWYLVCWLGTSCKDRMPVFDCFIKNFTLQYLFLS